MKKKMLWHCILSKKVLGCSGIRTQDHTILRQPHYPLRYREIYLATTQLSIVRSTGNPTRSLVKPLITLKSVHSVYLDFIGYGNNYTYSTHALSVESISVNCANSRNFNKSSNV